MKMLGSTRSKWVQMKRSKILSSPPLRLPNHSGLETDSHFEKPDPGCSKRVKCSTKQEPHEEEHRDVSFEDRKRWENGLRSITTGERKSGLSCPRREPVGFRTEST